MPIPEKGIGYLTHFTNAILSALMRWGHCIVCKTITPAWETQFVIWIMNNKNVKNRVTSRLANLPKRVIKTATALALILSAHTGNAQDFSKSFAPDSVDLGGRSTLTFTIDNSSNTNNIGNLDFTDNFPNGMVVADPANASTDCESSIIMTTNLTAIPGTSQVILDANGSTIFNNAEVLASGASCTVSVDVEATGVGQLVNTTEPLMADFTAGSSATATLTSTSTTLAIDSDFINDPVVPGDTLTLDFTLTNLDRNSAATNVAFTNDLAVTIPGLSFDVLIANDCQGTVSGVGTSNISFSGGQVPSGGSCTISTLLTVPASASLGVFTNTTSAVTGIINGSPVTGNQASENLFVETFPILTVELLEAFTLNPDPILTPGSDMVIRYTIANPSSTSGATDIEFTDELTNGGPLIGFLPFPIVAALPPTPNSPCGAGSSLTLTSVDIDQQGFVLSNGTLAANDQCSFDVTVTIPNTVPAGTFTNTTGAPSATIDGATRVGLAGSDTITIESAPTLSKGFSSSIVGPGSTVDLQFTLTHSENASADATNITFSDDLSAMFPGFTANIPASPDPVCGAGSSLSTSASGTLLTLSNGLLAPGESCEFSVTVNVPLNALIRTATNTTSLVSATIGASTITSPAATADLTVAGLIFSKEFIDNPVIAGEMTTLRFTIDNVSPTDNATDIAFTDNLSTTLSGLTGIGTPISNTCGGSLTSSTTFLVYTGGSVLSGGSCSIDVLLQVPLSATDGSFANVTSNLTASLASNPVTIDPARDALVVDSIRLELTKEFIDDPVEPGASATLRFTLTNLDTTRAASAIGFSDDFSAILPGTTIVVPSTPVCNGTLSSGGNDIDLSNASLAAGEECSFEVTLPVPANTATGVFTSTSSSVTGTIDSFTVAGSVDFTQSFAGLALVGGTTTLSFSITNNGSQPLTDIQFANNLNNVITGLAASNLPLNNICGDGSTLSGTSLVTFTGGSLGANERCDFDLQVSIPTTATAGVFSNVTTDLTVQGLTVAEPATADLAIASAPEFSKNILRETMGVGEFTGLIFTIDNTANTQPASALSFIDNLPNGLEIASPVDTSTTCTGGTLTAIAGSSSISYAGGTVAAGTTCTVNVLLQATAAVVAVNTSGDLTSSFGNSGTANDTVTILGASFSKTFADSSPVLAGDTVVLSFTITNQSAVSPLNGIEFIDNLNATLPGLTALGLPLSDACGDGSNLFLPTFATSAQTARGAEVSDNQLFLIGGNLAPGASCTFEVSLVVPSSTPPGTFTNVTSPIIGEGGSIVAQPAIDDLTISAATPPSLSKVFTPAEVDQGSVSRLVFTINNGRAEASGIGFTDNFPSGLQVATPANLINTCGGDFTNSSTVLSLSGASLAAEASCTISIDTVASSAGVFTNTTSELVSSLGSNGPATATLTVDNDRDNDGVLNDVDNCPFDANPDQTDLDQDGQGNVCDGDDDGDGLPDDYEIANGLDPLNSFDQQADPDGDGFTNEEEFAFGTDPNVADSDNDNNGVPDVIDQRRTQSIVPNILFPLLLDDNTL